MSRAARTLSVLIALACCLAPVVTATPVQADHRADPQNDHRHRARAHQQEEPSRTRARLHPRARSAGPHLAPRPELQPPVAPAPEPVSIETLTPSTLRPGTPVQVTGTVLNTSQDTWGDVQVGMLASPVPFTSEEEISAAAGTDPDAFTGSRVLDPGTFDDIGDVAPGQSRSYSYTVPFGQLELIGSEGAYWIGTEVRAFDGEGLRGSVARTLTFMPLLDQPKALPKVDMAVLWPMLAPVPWTGREYLDDSLSEQFAEGGRLQTLAELGADSRGVPLTWVVDPAVLDAARRMSDGYTLRGRDLPAGSDGATSALRWLRFVRSAIGNGVALSVPYGHPDVAALAHTAFRPGIRQAQRAAEEVLDRLEINNLRLMWAAHGRVDQQILDLAPQFDPALALLARDTLSNPLAGSVVGLRSQGSPRPPTQPFRWQGLVVDRGRSRAGLRAQPGQSVLQWRQQLLSNTALRALGDDPDRRTAVAMPTTRWWPDDEWRSAELFTSLKVPWVNQVSITDMMSASDGRYGGGFEYPDRLRRFELGPRMLDGLKRLRRTSRMVNNLLADPESNLQVTDAAFGLSSSLAWREDRATGRRIVRDAATTNREKVRSIDLETPSFVTLSSSSGRFPLSVTNQLAEPVRIHLTVSARDPDMTIEEIQPVTLQPDQRVTVTAFTNARGVGITTVTARMRTQEGKPFGRIATFQVRTTQIGAVVWVVMAIGGAVLFFAAGRRIFLRVRAHRREVQ